MSTISPQRALIVIDVQNEYVSGKLPIQYPPVGGSLANISRAMDGAAAAGIPIIVVQHTAPPSAPVFAKGSPGWQLHAVVTDRVHDHLILKTLPSAFADTDLAQWLAAHGIDTLTVIGYMSQNCDASTIVHAMHAGLKVEFLADASGSVAYRNAAGHATAEEIHRVFSVVFHSRYAAVLSTDAWIDAIQQQRATTMGNIWDSSLAALASA